MRFPFSVVDSFEDATRNFEALVQLGLYSGSGAPTIQGSKGEFYFRKDTPTTANQRVYVNTANGANWVGIL